VKPAVVQTYLWRQWQLGHKVYIVLLWRKIYQLKPWRIVQSLNSLFEILCICILLYTRTHTHTRARAHVHTHTHKHSQTYTPHLHTSRHTQTYTNTHTHTHTRPIIHTHHLPPNTNKLKSHKRLWPLYYYTQYHEVRVNSSFLSHNT
jgi:hypothetical protein